MTSSTTADQPTLHAFAALIRAARNQGPAA
jgi:hypothetical protein